MLTIRPAVPEDTPLIFTFIQELAEFEHLSHAVLADEEKLHRSLFAESPSARVLIAEVEGTPAGFALFHFMYSTFVAQAGLFLEDLFVRPDYRDHGIGKALMIHLSKTAIQEGCCRLDWTVLKWNEPAIGFYQRLGAKELDAWTRYRLEGDALTGLAEMVLRA